jgi:PAS domain S-box-containing protein
MAMETDAIIKGLKQKIALLEQEIERQERLNDALKESQQIENTILEKSLVGYYIVSEGKFRIVNPTVMAYTGYSLKELVGRNANFMIHPDDRKKLLKMTKERLAQKSASPYEFRIITKRGEIRWIMEVIAPILFEGKPAILGNSINISQLKKAEEKLIESEILYRTIFEMTGTSTIIIEDDKTISLVNSEFEKLTGFRKGDTEGKMTWLEVVDKRDQPWMIELHRKILIDPYSVPRNYEFRIVDSSGRVKYLYQTAGVIPGTRKVISSSMDITKLKEKEEELTIKSRSLEDLNAALRVMLRQREQDREELENTLISNVKEFVLPYIEKLKNGYIENNYMTYINLIESSLQQILSPFSRKLSSKFSQLTPKEIQVANLIKDGKSSKEIADLLNVSSSAIDVDRYRIRTKLGLNNKKANLRSYLSSIG